MKLNAAQLAALATGASPEVIASLAVAPEANPPGNPAAADAAAAPGADDAAAATAASAAATGAATPTAPPAAGAPAAAAAVPAVPAVPDNSAVVAHLTGQLADVNAALLAAKVESEGFKAQAAAVEGLVATLRTALGERLVALGASADAATGYNATNIAAEYTRIDGVFKTQFRVGGVAAAASPEEKDTAAAIDPMLAEAFRHSLIK